VETKKVNEAVKNNPEKFPAGYFITLELDELDSSRSKISTLNESGRGHNIKYLPKAFTEKGLYMLATILKSPNATQTTIAIVETFAKLREFSDIITSIPNVRDEAAQESLMIRGSEIFSEIIDETIMEIVGNETSFELNMGAVKMKHTIKREKRKV